MNSWLLYKYIGILYLLILFMLTKYLIIAIVCYCIYLAFSKGIKLLAYLLIALAILYVFTDNSIVHYVGDKVIDGAVQIKENGIGTGNIIETQTIFESIVSTVKDYVGK